MLIHRLADRVRPYAPPRLFSLIRRVGTAVLTPALFSFHSGHFKSSLYGIAVDSASQPIPWYTYPVLEFLATRNFAGRRVLEWGAGQSTLWWAKQAAEVVSFESDKDWFDKLSGTLPSNVKLSLAAVTVEDAELSGLFDVIVIDGLDRRKCAEKSIDYLAEGGVAILDNAEVNWGVKWGPPDYSIIELFHRRGFQRVDFYGYVPGVVFEECTSLFFRDRCFLFESSRPPQRTRSSR